MEKGTESKITKIIGELNKASKTHKGQADRLTTILSVLKGANKAVSYPHLTLPTTPYV